MIKSLLKYSLGREYSSSSSIFSPSFHHIIYGGGLGIERNQVMHLSKKSKVSSFFSSNEGLTLDRETSGFRNSLRRLIYLYQLYVDNKRRILLNVVFKNQSWMHSLYVRFHSPREVCRDSSQKFHSHDAVI